MTRSTTNYPFFVCYIYNNSSYTWVENERSYKCNMYNRKNNKIKNYRKEPE